MPVALSAVQSLLAILRKRCSTGLWGTGSALSRDAGLLLVRELDEGIVCSVPIDGYGQPATVDLYPEAEEWTCDCGGADPCAHVVASALALELSLRTSAPLRQAATVQTTLRYVLTSSPRGVICSRELVASDGSSTPLRGALSDAPGAPAASDADLAIDRIEQVRSGQNVPPHRVEELLLSLSRSEDVRVATESVQIQTDPLIARVTVLDRPKGYLLRAERDPAVTSDFAPGIARCGATLRPIPSQRVMGRPWSELPFEWLVARRDVIELVTETLPALARSAALEVRAKLPRVNQSLRPRVALGASLLPHLLSVVPGLVYGDPPCARVEGARLEYLSGDEIPLRDPAAEVELGHRLRDELGLVLGVRADFRGADVARFIARLKTSKLGDNTDASAPFGRDELVPRFVARDDGFELTFELPGTPGTDPSEGNPAVAGVDPAVVITAWRDGLELVPLTDGTWQPLPLAWLREHGHRVADLLAARVDDEGKVMPAALPALGRLCEALEQPIPARLEGMRALVDGFTSLPRSALPSDLRAELRPYQQRGVDWLCFLRDAGIGAVLADDMGLGKTLQTICALRGRALVVAPRSVMDNWASEIGRFRPSLRVSVFHGPERELDPRADVTLTTYSVLRLDAELLTKERWDVAVLDEAQAIKNPDSQTSRAAYGLRAAWRVALSGTPVENRLEELWSLFHFTNAGLLGGRSDFDDRYGAPIAQGDREAAKRLRERTSTLVLRRLKRDVAPELPPRSEVVLRCELDERERAVYDAVRAAAQRDVVEALAGGGTSLAVLEALLRLRQAACHSGLIPGQSADVSSKVQCLVDALESAAADGHHALVFSQWTSLLDRVEPHLRERSIAFVRLDGSTRDRASVVAEFQSPAGPPVMLVSLKAGGTGLNLTAADHVFLLDPWWNPAVEDQAADRAHRIGQQRPVTVYRLIARDTVEERILELQARKRALAVAALDGADPSASLTRDDLLALFN